MIKIGEDEYYELLEDYDSVKVIESYTVEAEKVRTVWLIEGVGKLIAECKGIPRRGRDSFIKDGKNWRYSRTFKRVLVIGDKYVE